MKIICDNREPKVIEFLRELGGVDLEIGQLNVADFITSEKDFIERKEGKDMVSSRRSGRLLEQMKRLREVATNPIIIIEDLPEAFQYTRMVIKKDKLGKVRKKWPEKVNVPASEVYGILASLALKHHCIIIPTRNPADTAVLLKELAIKGQEMGRGLPIARGRSRMSNLQEERDWFLQGLRDLGPVALTALNKLFNTPWKVMTAIGKTEVTWTGKRGQQLKSPKFGNETQLTDLKGIGPRTLLRWQKILWGEGE